VLNAEKQSEVHNHPLPSEWKISPKVLEDITITAQNNSRVTPKELQNSVGMSYIPIEVSHTTSCKLGAHTNSCKKS